MGVRVYFKCDDCDAKAGPFFLHKFFRSVSGRSFGFGRYFWPDIETVAPAGWVVSDYVGATYCPECAKVIEKEIADHA